MYPFSFLATVFQLSYRYFCKDCVLGAMTQRESLNYALFMSL